MVLGDFTTLLLLQILKFYRFPCIILIFTIFSKNLKMSGIKMLVRVFI